jgi:hypothetical protein
MKTRIKFVTVRMCFVALLAGTQDSSVQGAAPIAQQAYIKASNTESNDAFGWSVAISGDTMVVGAHDEGSSASGVNGNQNDNSLFRAGAAYVYVRTGTNWTQQAYLKASNTGAYDVFGWSVAISGDTVVIGAFGEDSSGTGVNGNQNDEGINGAGAAYVFVRSGSNWSQQAYLKASNPGYHNWFGYVVAISGDMLVVGAYGEESNATGINGNQSNNTAPGSGAAYVFVRSGTNWSQQAYLKASNTEAGDEFGSAVAISGDTIVIGAEGEDSNATGVNGNQSNNSASYSGAAYVFVRSEINWTQQAYLKASNTRTAAEFAGTVAISGDTLVVGSGSESSNATGVDGNQSNTSAPEAGAAYVFVRNGTNWGQQAYLKASNAEAGDQFAKVAVSGDTVVIGAVSEPSNATGVNGNQNDNSAPIAGAAYVFVRSGTNWSQQAYLKASNTRPYDEFSWGVAVSGDTVVIGADGEFSDATGVNGDQSNTNAPVAGAAYVFTGLGPLAPQLAIEQSAANVRVFWPLAAANFLLDEADDLNVSPTINWTQVALPRQTNATHISVTVPLPAGNKFYRLRKQ